VTVNTAILTYCAAIVGKNGPTLHAHTGSSNHWAELSRRVHVRRAMMQWRTVHVVYAARQHIWRATRICDGTLPRLASGISTGHGNFFPSRLVEPIGANLRVDDMLKAGDASRLFVG
jgi:hypothetical protein